MKDWCVKLLLLSGILFFPAWIQAQTKVCVVNECNYRNESNDFLPLVEKFYVENSSPVPEETLANIAKRKKAIEEYLFLNGDKSVRSTGVENQQAADIVTEKVAEHLMKKGFDTVVPTQQELKALRKKFDSDSKNASLPDEKEKFREFLCNHYGTDMLAALTGSRFDMLLTGDKRKAAGKKAVDAKIELSGVNTWEVYRSGESVRNLTADGSAEITWRGITRLQLITGDYNCRSNFEKEKTEYPVGGFFLPMIAHVAAEAAENFEQNL